LKRGVRSTATPTSPPTVRSPAVPKFLPLLALAAGAWTLAGCGGDDEDEAGQPGARGAAQAAVCQLRPLRGDTGLPADFPTIDGITFVKSEQAGPSRIVEGYANGELEDVYEELHDAFESSDYAITFDEREENDAEISFEGGRQSGQVKLADECGRDDRLYLRITSRQTG
jgi:hypothetical protein